MMMPQRDPLPAHLATEEGVYGVILVAGMIVASGSHELHSWSVFVAVASTVVVFWAAHVYAGTIARHRHADGSITRISTAFVLALSRSWGLLVSALIPASILLLGASHTVPDDVAIWLALWAGVAVLAVLGFLAFRRQGSRVPICLLGSLTTAGFGVLMIVLKAALH